MYDEVCVEGKDDDGYVYNLNGNLLILDNWTAEPSNIKENREEFEDVVDEM
jgi:hypothetical protein